MSRQATPTTTREGNDPVQTPVTVYTVPACASCASCAAIKRFLHARSVAFEEKNVREDPGALAEMQELAGVRIAPVTVIGDQAFYGTFEDQRPRIEAALKEHS